MLFGPSAAGGAYIPAFCDVVIMRDGNASMYLGSPRMAEMVIGEKVSLEEMGGAKMHTARRGCGHFLVQTDEEGIDLAKPLPLLLPQPLGVEPPRRRRPSRRADAVDPRARSPRTRTSPSTCASCSTRWSTRTRSSRSTSAGRKELIVGYARLDGRVVGIVANQPKFKGGVLFVDSADKAARFIWTCNAFNIPLLFLADVPGLHDRHRGRAPGHHPPRREDDLGGVARRPCRSCR